ncbi:MAG TPA: GGDEF domain-containing protein [Polyangiaceae bacterium]|jgi:diguanylate cyclase (GGDEF)-like protein
MSDDLNKTQKLGVMKDEPAPRSSNRPSLVQWEEEESSTRTTDAAIVAALPSNPALQGTRGVLTVVSGPSTGRVFTVAESGQETIVGRGKEAQVRIDDAGASREHARFLETPDGSYVVEDMGSTNGTFVDGKRIERAELHSGDRIHIGPNVIISFAVVAAQAEHVAQQLYESSVRDALTRIYNRRYLVERLASEFAYAKRHKTRLGVILFDLDLFKRVNDTHGHLAGDEVLREVAALVQRMVRAEDVLARFGGEEFVLLVRGIEHVNVGRFAERVRSAVERLEVAFEDLVLHVTVSLGFATIDELAEDHRDADGLLGLADERLYKAKSDGRNRVCGA